MVYLERFSIGPRHLRRELRLNVGLGFPYCATEKRQRARCFSERLPLKRALLSRSQSSHQHELMVFSPSLGLIKALLVKIFPVPFPSIRQSFCPVFGRLWLGLGFQVLAAMINLRKVFMFPVPFPLSRSPF